MRAAIVKLTTSSAEIRGKRQARIVGDSDIRTPDIGKGAFDKNQAWSTKEARKEPASSEGNITVGIACAEGESSPDRDGSEIYWCSPELFASVRRPNGCEGDAQEI